MVKSHYDEDALIYLIVVDTVFCPTSVHASKQMPKFKKKKKKVQNCKFHSQKRVTNKCNMIG